MSLNFKQPHELHSKVIETLDNPTTTRGHGVHNEIRGVLYYLRHEHNFTRDQLWEVLNAKDGYARNPAVPWKELNDLVEGLFDGKGAVAKTKTAVEVASAHAAENRSNLHLDKFTKQTSFFQIKTKRKPIKPHPIQIATWKERAETEIKRHEGRKEIGESLDVLTERPAQKTHLQFIDALYQLFDDNENVSIVTACNSLGKPIANDRSMPCREWLDTLNESASGMYPFEGLAARRGGVWWRVNPMQKEGSGKGGAMTDNDVADFRHLLVENDVLPMTTQLLLLHSLYESGRLKPLSIVDSAGKSYHSLVECKAANAEEYKAKADDILYPLHEEFGFDLGNSNPSRMSRAAGFSRLIGSRSGGRETQTLIYLAERRSR
jgi:hypothetical protein